ncbi:ATP synthase subunit f, mitochondrial [Mycena indigotica]|uniref:ATP synthase subunit f, mitochondrial n=1 Tax=Mycena indigotica TaxID=2126181 RepID=A0A8H6VSC9_9AGAR|nr:ATP synthase subunit f, mitochondrial [Mycena indigotica]KAF7292217.1 ATP synthase subunit f, mitochondrial [Mycena indigotica]
MHASLIRRSLGGLVPPQNRHPPSSLCSGDSAGPLGPLVSFYSKLPKGRAPAPAVAGVKGRLFSGKNASAKPVLALIGGLWLVGYTLDYQRACYGPSSTTVMLTYSLLPPPSFQPLVSFSPVHLTQEQRALDVVPRVVLIQVERMPALSPLHPVVEAASTPSACAHTNGALHSSVIYPVDVQSHPLLSLTLNPVPPSSSIDTVCGQQRMCQRTSREVLLALPPSPTVRSASDERGGAWVKELAEDGTHAPAASG